MRAQLSAQPPATVKADAPERFDGMARLPAMSPAAVTMRMTKQRAGFSDEVREQALALYVDLGPTEAARRLGPDGPDKATITRWAKRAGATTRRAELTQAATAAHVADWRARRAALADRFGQVAAEALEKSSAAIGEDDAGTARGMMITAAVGVDKADQLSGVTLEGLQAANRVDPVQIAQAVAMVLDGARQRAQAIDVASVETR
jgi:hypothetical protein